jgi:hypothetical protein
MNSLYFVNLFLMEINFRIKAGILVSNSKYLRDCERYFSNSLHTGLNYESIVTAGEMFSFYLLECSL